MSASVLSSKTWTEKERERQHEESPQCLCIYLETNETGVSEGGCLSIINNNNNNNQTTSTITLSHMHTQRDVQPGPDTQHLTNR